MRRWVAIVKVIFEAETYANAMAAAEVARTNAERELEMDEGDYATVATIVPLGVDDTRDEIVAILRRARNTLIRLGNQRTVDAAREVEMIADIVSNPAADFDYHPPYDHGKFMDVMEQVLKGKDPGV